MSAELNKELSYELIGSDLQVLEINLTPGQAVIGEIGSMVYMGAEIKMSTSTGGGIFKGLKRMMGQGGFFLSSFSHVGSEPSCTIGFSAPYPGKILPIDLHKAGNVFFCQKDAFLCASEGTEVDIALTQRLGAGFFGGDGFILQKLMGDGLAFVHAGGALIRKNLQAGEVLRVEAGALVGFTQGVDYNIQFVGGLTNTLFGGEGIFLASLKGPGTVILQSLPLSRLADRLIHATRK